MSSGHILYIPLILALGVVLGFILGGRAARDALAMEQKRDAERAAKRAAREARRAEGDVGGAGGASGA